MLTPTRTQLSHFGTSISNTHFTEYSPVRKIARTPSDESFEFLRRAPKKCQMPTELKVLYIEAAKSANVVKKLSFDDNQSISTQSSSPTVSAFSLSENPTVSPFD